jgi:hypothetical protein
LKSYLILIHDDHLLVWRDPEFQNVIHLLLGRRPLVRAVTAEDDQLVATGAQLIRQAWHNPVPHSHCFCSPQHAVGQGLHRQMGMLIVCSEAAIEIHGLA